MTKKPTKARPDEPTPHDAGRKMKEGVAPLHKFRPWPENPRTHPPAEIAALADLLTRYGFDQKIVVDEDWWILKGHGRREAAALAKMDEAPYVQRFDLTPAEKLAMRIEDNAIPLLAGWDRQLVSGAVAQLKSFGYDINRLGFGEAQLVSFTTLPGPPSQFQSFGENIPTEFCCPSCGYKWSGKRSPDAQAETPPKNGRGARART